MALSAELGKAKLTPEELRSEAAVTLERTDAGPTLTKSHLTVTARIPGASEEQFRAAADAAKAGCAISRVLNLTVTLDAKLT
jgi:lipoyl-dependent peroxiredoxin